MPEVFIAIRSCSFLNAWYDKIMMLCLALLAVAWIKPERDLVCSPEPLVYRVLQIAMWSRYNESSSQSWPVSAHEEGVTPFSRYPLQDTFYNTLAYSHIVFAVPYLSLILWQFLATKGTPDHVQRGLVLKWLALCVVGGGWMLQIRHSWFSDPKVFEKHPAPSLQEDTHRPFRKLVSGSECLFIKGASISVFGFCRPEGLCDSTPPCSISEEGERSKLPSLRIMMALPLATLTPKYFLKDLHSRKRIQFTTWCPRHTLVCFLLHRQIISTCTVLLLTSYSFHNLPKLRHLCTITEVLFSLPFARSFVSAFGTSTVVSALSCYLLGVKDKSRLAPAKGTRHLIILDFAHVKTFAIRLEAIAITLFLHRHTASHHLGSCLGVLGRGCQRLRLHHSTFGEATSMESWTCDLLPLTRRNKPKQEKETLFSLFLCVLHTVPFLSLLFPFFAFLVGLCCPLLCSKIDETLHQGALMGGKCFGR